MKRIMYVLACEYSGEVTAVSFKNFENATKVYVDEVWSREGILIPPIISINDHWKVVGDTLKKMTEEEIENSLILKMRKAAQENNRTLYDSLREQHIEKINEYRKNNVAPVNTSKAKMVAKPYHTSILIITKDENEYLIEFLEHHLNLGFDHIYIYDNNSTIPVSETIKELPSAMQSKISVELYSFTDNNSFQLGCYQKWFNEHREETDWVAVIDTDELIELRKAKTISEFLNNFDDDVATVQLHWENYNANGHATKTVGTMEERFTTIKPLPVLPRTVKSIHRTAYITGIDTHWGYIYYGKKVDALGKEITYGEDREPKKDADAIAVVKHYFTKSYEEWVNKMNRGNVSNFFHRRYEEFFWHNPDLENLFDKSLAGWKMVGEIDNK